MRLRGGTAAAAAVLIAVGGVGGCKKETTGSSGPQETAVGGAALSAVDSLTVKGRDPKTGYDRDRFGTAWADTDSNRCDTRVISVLRWVTEVFVQLKPGAVSCAY